MENGLRRSHNAECLECLLLSISLLQLSVCVFYVSIAIRQSYMQFVHFFLQSMKLWVATEFLT